MLVILGNFTHLNPFLLQKGFFFLWKRIISKTLSRAKIFYENAVSLYLIGGFCDYGTVLDPVYPAHGE